MGSYKFGTLNNKEIDMFRFPLSYRDAPLVFACKILWNVFETLHLRMPYPEVIFGIIIGSKPERVEQTTNDLGIIDTIDLTWYRYPQCKPNFHDHYMICYIMKVGSRTMPVLVPNVSYGKPSNDIDICFFNNWGDDLYTYPSAYAFAVMPKPVVVRGLI